MIRRYLIAGFNIDIDFREDIILEERLSEYIAYEKTPADIKMRIEKTDSEIEVRKKNLTKLSDIAFFYTTPDRDIIFYYDSVISKTVAKIEFSKDYNDINVTLYELKKNHGVEDNMLMFNVVGTAFNYALFTHQSFVFHSSSVCYNDEGIVFSAKSGTGKSTHTSLWLKNFPGTYILNDDTPCITLKKDGVFYLCGTPWAGTTGINKNAMVPLKAIVFLERGAENVISPMPPQEAINPFFEGIRTPLTDEMFSETLDTLNMLFIKVPVYKLKCNMNSEAAIVARDGIFGNK